jgi:hypothetical protein
MGEPEVDAGSRQAGGEWVGESELTPGEKVVRHECGSLFWAVVLTQVADVVVVEYRQGHEGVGVLPLYHCPRCGKPLRLWWIVSTQDERLPDGAMDEEGGCGW